MPHHHPPLTQLILDLAAASPDRLRKADPVKIAKHYGVKLEHAREYLERARQR